MQKPSATQSSLLEVNLAKKHWHSLLLLPVQRALCLLALRDLLLSGHQAVPCCRSPRGLLPAVAAVTWDMSGPKAPRAAQQPACAPAAPAPLSLCDALDKQPEEKSPDLVLTAAEELLKEVKIERSLGCSDRTLVGFVIWPG